jgi:hypothetical protein
MISDSATGNEAKGDANSEQRLGRHVRLLSSAVSVRLTAANSNVCGRLFEVKSRPRANPVRGVGG